MKTVWNRVHLDLRPYPGDDLEAEAARLRALGATAIDLGQSDVPWTVLADPEGNEFCLLTPRLTEPATPVSFVALPTENRTAATEFGQRPYCGKK